MVIVAQVTRIELFPGVRLTAVHTNTFKSCVLGAQFLAPLSPETAAANALVPSVLRRGTAKHPDMESISAALDELFDFFPSDTALPQYALDPPAAEKPALDEP